MLQYHFDILSASRKKILELIKDLSIEQLNNIPQNFNNNIAWNFGHLLVTQQLVCYKMTGLSCHVSEDYIKKYIKGSKPEEEICEEEIGNIKELFIMLISNTQKDIQERKFTAYKSYTTSYGITLNSIQDAIIFNNIHEGLHLGYIMALKRNVSQR